MKILVHIHLFRQFFTLIFKWLSFFWRNSLCCTPSPKNLIKVTSIYEKKKKNITTNYKLQNGCHDNNIHFTGWQNMNSLGIKTRSMNMFSISILLRCFGTRFSVKSEKIFFSACNLSNYKPMLQICLISIYHISISLKATVLTM